MNKVTLIGNLTSDPVIRSTANGTSVSTFTLAVGRKYKDADGNKQTDFISCIAWKQTADLVCKYLKKGSKAAVNGTLQTRTWTDQEGTKHYVTEVLVDDVEFLSPKSQTSNDYFSTEHFNEYLDE